MAPFFSQSDPLPTPETLESKTILFDKKCQSLDLSDILGPHNITHYRGYLNKKIMSISCIAEEVHRNQRNSQGYMSVKQFVSEHESTLYLVSINDEHPRYYNFSATRWDLSPRKQIPIPDKIPGSTKCEKQQ